MTIPAVDFSKPDALIHELFDPDESVRTQFKNRFSGQAIEFSEAIAPAFARFPKFSEDGQYCIQTALACGFIHGVLDDSVTSIKLLLTGKVTAAGNLFRQAIEGICMAIMCGYQGRLLIGGKECDYWDLVANHAKEVEGNLAAKQLAKNWDKLGLNLEGAEQLKSTLGLYNKHSHAGIVAMAYRMELGPNGVIYIGGHFDDAKVEGYAVEFRERVELAKLVVKVMDYLWPNIRVIGERARSSLIALPVTGGA